MTNTPVTLRLICEVADVRTVEDARQKLDAFREAVIPSQNYGLTFYESYDEPTSGYASVSWAPGDVQTLRPELTDEQAEGFLERNERDMRDRMIEEGWSAMQTLLDLDDQLPPAITLGSRVFWTDPAGPEPDEDGGGDCSGPGTVVNASEDPITTDTVITVKKDDEGEVECYAHELRVITDETENPQ